MGFEPSPSNIGDKLVLIVDPDCHNHLTVGRMQNQLMRLDWNDTFLNVDHLKASFPERKSVSITGRHSPDPPFR